MKRLAFVVVMFALTMLAFAEPGQAVQTGGSCGPGKSCVAKSFKATSATTINTVPASFVIGGSPATPYAMCVDKDCRTEITYNYGGDALWLYNRANAVLLTVEPGRITGNKYFTSSQGYAAPVAFASFPSASGAAGRLLYDSTSNVWRWSDGTTWQQLAKTADLPSTRKIWTALSSSGSAETAPEGVNFLGPFTAETVVRIDSIDCSWQTAGTGGTTGVVAQIYDVTAAAQVCTCTLGACSTTARTPLSCDCAHGVTSGAGHVLTMRLTTGTDCTTNPAGLVCNVMMDP